MILFIFWEDTHHFRGGKLGDNMRNVVCSRSEFHIPLPEPAVEKPPAGAALLRRSHNQQRARPPVSPLQPHAFVFSLAASADFMTVEYLP